MYRSSSVASFFARKRFQPIQATFDPRMLSITELMAISSTRKAVNRRPCRRSSLRGASSLIRGYTGVVGRDEHSAKARYQGQVHNRRLSGSAFGGSRPTRYVHKLRRIRPSNTELIGYRAGVELADLLRDADIFCCPSIWNDPFPMAILEAMAMGCLWWPQPPAAYRNNSPTEEGSCSPG